MVVISMVGVQGLGMRLDIDSDMFQASLAYLKKCLALAVQPTTKQK